MYGLLEFIKHYRPDVLLLQEIKCTEDNFPYLELEDVGYNCLVSGRKTHNGVAILSKFRLTLEAKNLPNFNFSPFYGENENEARYIEALVETDDTAFRVASVYVPNGGGAAEGEILEESERFIYKLNFFDRLHMHFKSILQYDEIAIFGGDLNVAPKEIDVYDHKHLAGSVCYNPLEQRKFESLLNLGLYDAYRVANKHKKEFTWWDYRSSSFKFNKGMRIDHLLLSPLAVDNLSSCEIISSIREQEKPSDHCPVICELKFSN